MLRPTDQMSIKEIDLAKLEPFLGAGSEIKAVIRDVAGRLSVPEGIEDGAPEVTGSVIDERRKVLREIALRRGQAKFRKMLIKRYGPRCQISRCAFPRSFGGRPYSAFRQKRRQSKSPTGFCCEATFTRCSILACSGLSLQNCRSLCILQSIRPAIPNLRLRRFFLTAREVRVPEALRQRWDFFQERLGDC